MSTVIEGPSAAGIRAAAGSVSGGNRQGPGQGYVQVPVDLLATQPRVLALWCVLTRLSRGRGVAWPRQQTVAAALGFGDVADPRPRVSQTVRAAAAAGVIEVDRTFDRERRRTSVRYRVQRMARPGDGRSWVDLPLAVLDELAAGSLSASGLRWWLRWADVCGRDGWTTAPLGRLAERWGETARSVRSHRTRLVEAGLLEVTAVSGRYTLTSLPGRIDLDAHLGRLGDAPQPENVGAERICKSPRNGSISDPGTDLYTERPLQNIPRTETPAPASASADQYRPNAARAASSPPSASKPETQDSTRPATKAEVDRQVAEVMRRLPGLAGCQPWYRRGLISLLRQALTWPVGPEAIVHAWSLVAVVEDSDDPWSPNGRHVPLLRKALAALIADIAAGACRACGRYPDQPRDCTTCAPAPAATDDPDVLAAAAEDGRCVACGTTDSVTVRTELPIPVPACDACWATAQLQEASHG